MLTMTEGLQNERQLTEFLQPLDTDGLLKHNMVHTLRVLRFSIYVP